MNHDHDALQLQITRFALPAIIVMFYAMAALHFDYTPDSTYAGLLQVHQPAAADGSTPGVPWALLLALAGPLQLDPLLVSKVLSLFFSCVVIMLGFLVAQQILMDRLMAFAVALLTAVQPAMLCLAVSGSPMPLAAALTLAAVFFMLRNEYLLAAVFAGVCGLAYWQGAALLLFVVLDVLVNSLDLRRGIRVASGVFLIGVVTWAPAMMYTLLNGHGLRIPVIPPVDLLAPHSPLFVLALVLPGLLISAALFSGVRGGSEIRSLLRVHAVSLTLLAWLVIAAMPDARMAIAALPLFFAYALFSLRVLLVPAGRERSYYAAGFLLAGLMIIPGQWEYYSETVPAMEQATVESQELTTIAYWVRSQTGGSETVVVSGRPGILAYISGRDVLAGNSGKADIVVAPSGPGAGYRIAFDPGLEHPEEFIGATTRWRAWRKL